MRFECNFRNASHKIPISSLLLQTVGHLSARPSSGDDRRLGHCHVHNTQTLMLQQAARDSTPQQSSTAAANDSFRTQRAAAAALPTLEKAMMAN
jgi:hypothetical protein